MKAVLHDVKRCRGCMRCVAACSAEHGLAEPTALGVYGADGLSAKQLTSLAKLAGDHFVRQHCYHCLEPACAAACLVGALEKTPDGPVVYDETKCIGCRYCMLACPFQAPRYEWDQVVPLVKKCDLCADREGGPACVEACESDATIYGDRDELLRIAHQRIQKNPGSYLPHVWGQYEMGGTSVLFISDVSLDELWPTELGATSVPDLVVPLAEETPFLFGGALAALAGLWVIQRRNQRAEERVAEMSRAKEEQA